MWLYLDLYGIFRMIYARDLSCCRSARILLHTWSSQHAHVVELREQRDRVALPRMTHCWALCLATGWDVAAASCGVVPLPLCRAVALPPPTPPPWTSGRDGGLRMLSSTTAALGAASATPHPPTIPTTTTTASEGPGTSASHPFS
ncbi:hypothetical protein TNIN_340761 [Trichonephila inaurata madagascariensis]|uniref:Uncharacterized protein n=1 Tax=Trichonephila inaurata madagascariensis TaxID=2747483 RepID=A0A8X6XWC8_9ARAC|nr:hypothetical protein TNIN_340761 [Trichonephila inaurata madagascariensis]